MNVTKMQMLQGVFRHIFQQEKIFSNVLFHNEDQHNIYIWTIVSVFHSRLLNICLVSLPIVNLAFISQIVLFSCKFVILLYYLNLCSIQLFIFK